MSTGMGVLTVIRRLLFREHVREHAAIEEHFAEVDTTQTEQEVRLRRLEIELRLRSRRLTDPP